MTYEFDLCVIGGGSGGLAAAKRAAKYGAKVAIAEQAHLGGTCVNLGCIPKKLMVYAADFAQLLRDAPGYGWEIGAVQFDWLRFVALRDQELVRIRQVQERLLMQAGIRVIRGTAQFVDAHTLEVGDRTLKANKILIAVGGKPNRLQIPGIEHAITSDEIFTLPQLPQRLVVLGGGYIGVEFASIFRGFGVEVTMMNPESCLLSGFDRDLGQAVREGLIQRGIHSLCNTQAEAIGRTDDGLQVTLTGEHTGPIAADQVLCAVGRSPKLDHLNLKQAGVELDGKAIAVDETNCTSQPHIYAVGDCANRMQLTPVARAAGQAFADSVFGDHPPEPVDYTWVPTAIFARPEAASIGMTETQAYEKLGQENVQCHRTEFRSLFNRLGHAPESMQVKLVVDRASDRVLGLQIIGDEAAEIIQGFGLAIKQGITKAELDRTIGIHPTSAEELFSI
jgi:glutathione reductase (NADPH)